MNNLERRMTNETKTSNGNPDENPTIGQKFKNFVASTTAGWVAYTPIMTPIEHYYSGMDWDEVGLTRLIAGFGHLIGLPPYQKVREYLGRKFDVGEDDTIKQGIVNAVSFVPTHPPTYALILAGGGASWDEMAASIPIGLGVVMVTSPVFAPFMEFWRTKVFGMEETYKENDNEENK